MNNIVLKSLAVENYASFADRIMFTTEIDSSKKEYLENTFEIADSRFSMERMVQEKLFFVRFFVRLNDY